MTVEELKNGNKYNFEFNIGEDYNGVETDEWGCAYCWIDDDIGVEYNYCVEDGENHSAIYVDEYNKEEKTIYANSEKYIHYEIDFSDDNWKDKLENAMCSALIELFNL